MITLTREEAQQVLDALEAAWYHVGTLVPTEGAIDLYDAANKSLRAKLSEPDDVPKWVYQKAVPEGTEAHHWAVVMHDMDKTVEGWSEDVKMYYDGKLIAPQPEPEPAAWYHEEKYRTHFTTKPSNELKYTHWKPLYTAPPQQKGK